MTSVLSVLTRITGIILSGGLYIFGVLYLASPPLGTDLGSENMAAAFGILPEVVKVAAKFVVAFPFMLHSCNGIRYLVWDTARLMQNHQVVRTGWISVGCSMIGALLLAKYA